MHTVPRTASDECDECDGCQRWRGESELKSLPDERKKMKFQVDHGGYTSQGLLRDAIFDLGFSGSVVLHHPKDTTMHIRIDFDDLPSDTFQAIRSRARNYVEECLRDVGSVQGIPDADTSTRRNE